MLLTQTLLWTIAGPDRGRVCSLSHGLLLRSLITEKWTFSYDVQIRRTSGRLFLQVMWKYQEQASFPLSEAEYVAHLDQVAGYLTAWNVVDQVRGFVAKTKEKPRLGKAVNILLDLGDRASEWLLEEF
jgi:Domain of unknown function (DUF3067)